MDASSGQAGPREEIRLDGPPRPGSDGGIGKLFPADPSVGIGLMGTDCQHCVKKARPVLPIFPDCRCLGCNIPYHPQVLYKYSPGMAVFPHLFYGKTKPVGLSVIVIGVLSQDHNLHLMRRRKMKRIEQIFRRRKKSFLFCILSSRFYKVWHSKAGETHLSAPPASLPL